MRTVIFMLPTMLIASGCYTYTPISVSALTPEMDVRVETSETTTQRLEGRVVEVGDDTMSLLHEARPGAADRSRTVAIAELTSVHQRRFSPTRTIAVIGAGVAIGIGALFLTDSNPGDTRGPGGSGDFSVLPILRHLLAAPR